MGRSASPVFACGAANLRDHNTATAKHQLGQIAEDSGHLYVYVKATEAITALDVVVASTAHVTVANITGFSNTGGFETGKFPWVEDSGETWTPGAYVNSYLYIGGGTGVGQVKRIVRNTATRAYFAALHPNLGSGGEADVFTTAPDITSDITIVSPWQIARSVAGDRLQTPVGTCPQAMTSGYYGWACLWGVCQVSGGATAVLDTPVSVGGTATGEAGICATTEDVGDVVSFGLALFAGADNTGWPVFVRML